MELNYVTVILCICRPPEAKTTTGIVVSHTVACVRLCAIVHDSLSTEVRQRLLALTVARCCAYFRIVSSPIGLNAQLCCVRFDLPLHRLISINRSFVWRNVFTDLNVHCSTASVIKDMLRIKSRHAEIPGFSSSDVDCILEWLCVS